MNKFIQIFILLFSLFLGLLFNSCGPIHEWPTEPGKPSLGKGTKIRFVNTAYEIPPVDIYINGSKVYSYLTFKLATYYIDLKPGEHEIKIVRNSDSELIKRDTIKLDSNRFYIFNILGTTLRPEIKILDRTDLSIANNFSLVRFVNSSPEIGKVDVAVFNQVDNFLIADLDYKSASGFIKISSGTGKINLFKSGTENLIFTSSANFEAGKIYTVFFAGNIGATDSTSLNAYFLDETKYDIQSLFNFEQGVTKIRFINGITTTQSVQLTIDGVPFRTSLLFNQATSFQTFKAGARNIKVSLGSGQGYIDTTIIFSELKNYTVYLSNVAKNLSAIRIENESKNVTGNRAYLRIVNATQDLQNLLVNINSLLGQNSFELQNFASVSNYIETAPGQNIITLSSSGKPNLLSISAYLEGGRVYSAFVTGSYIGTDKNALMVSFVKDNDTLGQNLFSFEQVKSSIKLVNISPELDGIDLIVDNNPLFSNLSYKYASKYFQVNTGFRNVVVKVTGQQTNIFASTVNIEYNKKYILFAVDKLPTSEVVMLESSTRTIPFGKASIRFLNGIYDLPAIDIKIINSAGSTSITQNIFKNVTNYIDVVGGKNQIIITQSGTQNVLATAEAQLDVSTLYTIVLSGLSTGTNDKRYSIGFLKETDDVYQKLTEFSPVKTKLRFINGLYDNPTVDFYVDDTKLASNITYRLATELLQVPSGNSRNLKVNRSGSLTQIYSRISTIDYTKEYSFIVCGETAFPDGFVIENPVKTAPAGKSSIRFVHASTGLGSMSVSIVNSAGTVNIPNVTYKSTSSYVDLISGNNKITVTISSTSGNIILTSDAFLEEDKVYTVYILGNSGGSGEQALDINFLIESNPGAQQLFKFAPIKSKLRFINGSTDNPTLELNVDNEFVATNVSYKLATALLDVNSGVNKRVKVFEFGSTTPLLTQDFTLNHTKSYSLLVTNKKTNLEYIFFENPQKVVPAGKVSVRVVHGAYDLSQVDITFNNYTSKTKISGLSYKGTSSYVDLPAGFNEVIVTKTSSPGQLVLAIDATMEEGKLYTIYLLGNSSGNFGEEYSLNFLDETNRAGQFLFNFTPSQISRIRVINASPNSPGLDVTLDQSKLAQNVLFGNSSGYLFTRSGLREVKVTPGGTSSPILLSFNFQFETNKLYSLLLMDSVSLLTPILVEDMNFTMEEGKAYVRFINASSNSPPFDIKIGNPTGVIKHSYFTYQQITSYEPYDPQILSFVFTRTNSSEEIISLRGFSLVAGKAYTIVVLGFYQGQPGQQLQVKWFQDN